MFSFTDQERASLTEMSAVSKDTNGSEVLIGLTLDETAFYMNYTRHFLAGKNDYHNMARYLNLHDRHEAARLRILGMGQYLHNAKLSYPGHCGQAHVVDSGTVGFEGSVR